MPRIDINCDMGEGYGQDALIMPFISSVNIACGYHAGDLDTMRCTVESALIHNVAIGAHPSYPDKENFGRVDLLGKIVHLEDIPVIISEQIHLLQQVCIEFGTTLHHVKPHGALYNRAAKDKAVSAAIGAAITAVNPQLLFYGLSGSSMKQGAEQYKLQFVSEVFADRTYQEDGSLTPRTQPGAFIENTGKAIEQVLGMVQQQMVTTVNGKSIAIKADTICIHGDGKQAAAFAKAINMALKENDIEIGFSL